MPRRCRGGVNQFQPGSWHDSSGRGIDLGDDIEQSRQLFRAKFFGRCEDRVQLGPEILHALARANAVNENLGLCSEAIDAKIREQELGFRKNHFVVKITQQSEI